MQTPDILLARLQTLIGKVLKTPVELAPDTVAADVPGWDSHATVEIIFEVEDRFGFRMSSGEMEQITGVPSLIKIINSHVKIPAT